MGSMSSFFLILAPKRGGLSNQEIPAARGLDRQRNIAFLQSARAHFLSNGILDNPALVDYHQESTLF
jgi:hypothetical protein